MPQSSALRCVLAARQPSIGPLGRIFPATPGANVSKRNGTFAVLSANV